VEEVHSADCKQGKYSEGHVDTYGRVARVVELPYDFHSMDVVRYLLFDQGFQDTVDNSDVHEEVAGDAYLSHHRIRSYFEDSSKDRGASFQIGHLIWQGTCCSFQSFLVTSPYLSA